MEATTTIQLTHKEVIALRFLTVEPEMIQHAAEMAYYPTGRNGSRNHYFDSKEEVLQIYRNFHKLLRDPVPPADKPHTGFREET